MTSQERALADLARALEDIGVGYMLVGGQANAVWGEPRATLDIDVTVWAEGRADVVSQLTARFRAVVTEPESFVQSTRVLPLESDNGVRIDVIFGMLPFEEEAIRRAVPVRFALGEIRVCTPEDLILMKILSERDRDVADARGVALRRMESLDLAYLEPRIAELAALLDRPEIFAHWEKWKRAT